MRNLLEKKINQYWYSASRLPPFPLWPLLPFEYIYRVVSGFRQRQRKIVAVKGDGLPPIVVVGNITVGGTGKTPLLLALIQYCQSRGLKVGVVSRGYGGSISEPTVVTDRHSAADVGDEPMMLYKKTAVPVAICAERQRAVDLLSQSQVLDVVFSDDGLQHYAMPRSMELVVIDAKRGVGNGHQLPVGPLRERLERIALANAVVMNGGSTATKASRLTPVLAGASVPVHHMTMRLTGLLELKDASADVLALADFVATHPRVHAVAGIGHPERFFTSLRDVGFQVIEHPLPDHSAITPDMLAFDDQLPVLITEKDAVKCESFALSSPVYVVQAEADLEPELFKQLDEFLLQRLS